MQHLEVSCAVRPLKWSLGVKWLIGLCGISSAIDVTKFFFVFKFTLSLAAATS